MIIAGIRQCSLTDGPGKRFVVLLPGCQHSCSGCAASQGPASGVQFTLDELLTQMDFQPDLDGLTIAGGDPAAQAAECTELARAVRSRGLNVRCHSPYSFQAMLQAGGDILALLQETDVLVEPSRKVRAADSLAAGKTLLEE